DESNQKESGPPALEIGLQPFSRTGGPTQRFEPAEPSLATLMALRTRCTLGRRPANGSGVVRIGRRRSYNPGPDSEVVGRSGGQAAQVDRADVAVLQHVPGSQRGLL